MVPPCRGCRIAICLLLFLEASASAGEGPARVDAFGDPLPLGAVARFGTVRLRHGDFIYALAFSSDGRTLASGDSSGVVSTWDPATGKPLQRVRVGHGVFGLAFAPDGKTLAAGDHGDTIRLWDPATGKTLRTLTKAPHVLGVAFSPDGKLLASVGGDSKVYLRDRTTGKLLHSLVGHTRNTFCVAFSPDGQTIASGGYDGTVRLWDAASGREIRRFEGHAEGVLCVAFSPDGLTIATGGPDFTLRLWDVASGRQRHKIARIRGWVKGLAFLPDSKTVVNSADTDPDVRFWDVATGKEVRRLRARYEDGGALALSPDGKTLAVAGRNSTIRLWDVASGQERFADRGPTTRVMEMAFSPDGKWLATAGQIQPPRIWEVAAGGSRSHEVAADLPETNSPQTRALAFTPNGRTLVAGDSHHRLCFWDAATGKRLRELKGRDYGVVLHLSFSPKGDAFAAAGGNDCVELWDVAANRTRTVKFPEKGSVYGASPTFAAGKVATMGLDGVIRYWDTTSDKELSRFKAEDPQSHANLQLAPDGKLLAVHRVDRNAVHLWDAMAGKLLHKMEAGHRGVYTVAFSLDGRMLATGYSDDLNVHLWEVTTGKQIATFKLSSGWPWSLAFAPDGRSLAAGSSDTTALLLDVTGRAPSGQFPLARTPQELESLWGALGAQDPAKGYQAVWGLVAAPEQAVPTLGNGLLVAERKRRAALKWIPDLDAAQFAVRDKAMKELAALKAAAVPALREALTSNLSPEARRRVEVLIAQVSPAVSESLRALRGIHVLEQIATAEARQVLQTLVSDDPNTALAREARAALARLDRRASGR
jgi:WD40 repeat protein